jgi:hypothetical protein
MFMCGMVIFVITCHRGYLVCAIVFIVKLIVHQTQIEDVHLLQYVSIHLDDVHPFASI